MRKPLQQVVIGRIFQKFDGKENVEEIVPAAQDMKIFFSKHGPKNLTFASLANIGVVMGTKKGARFWAKVFRKALEENDLRSLRRRLASRDINNKNLILGLMKNPRDKSSIPSPKVINLYTPDRPATDDGKPNTYSCDIIRRIYDGLAA